MDIPEPGSRWRLRPALPEDEPFLKTLFAATNAMLRVLPPEFRPQLADMQYRGRQMTYAAEFPDAEDSIIQHRDGASIGRQLLHRKEGRVRVVDIAILEEWQGKGFGSEILCSLLEKCRRIGTPVDLHVAKGNPAFRIYERLGFKVLAEDDVSLEMTWRTGDAGPCVQESEREA